VNDFLEFIGGLKYPVLEAIFILSLSRFVHMQHLKGSIRHQTLSTPDLNITCLMDMECCQASCHGHKDQTRSVMT
jgi:hypothetical protein